MKPPIPTYIGENMIVEGSVWPKVIAVVVGIALVVGAYLFFTRKPAPTPPVAQPPKKK